MAVMRTAYALLKGVSKQSTTTSKTLRHPDATSMTSYINNRLAATSGSRHWSDLRADDNVASVVTLQPAVRSGILCPEVLTLCTATDGLGVCLGLCEDQNSTSSLRNSVVCATIPASSVTASVVGVTNTPGCVSTPSLCITTFSRRREYPADHSSTCFSADKIHCTSLQPSSKQITTNTAHKITTFNDSCVIRFKTTTYYRKVFLVTICIRMCFRNCCSFTWSRNYALFFGSQYLLPLWVPDGNLRPAAILLMTMSAIFAYPHSELPFRIHVAHSITPYATCDLGRCCKYVSRTWQCNFLFGFSVFVYRSVAQCVLIYQFLELPATRR